MAIEIKVTVTCSMCWPPKRPSLKFGVAGPKDITPKALKKRIESEGWIVEFNGDDIDTYCTKQCAE